MEHSSVPLLDGQRGINSTLGSPRNFSKPFGSPASSPPPRDSPYVTLHDFLHAQHEALPLLDLSPNQAVRPLRRKSSRRDLSGDFLPATSHQASSRQLPRLRSPDSQALLIPLPPLPPSTPQQHPSAASPSLSSTITTLQSTPTQTPVAQPGLDLPPSIEPACRVLLEPLRVKRKFPGPKPPKRLPRRAGDGGWLVFANVIGDSESVDHLQGHVQSVSVPERPRGGLAARGRRPETESIEAKRDRSVRFAGIWSESDEGESTDRSAQGQEKDATGDSTYTLSKFKFPTPPGYAWSGTFGHLSEPTPPTSPATLHYRGASFDLVNPHASLLLGTKEFETPAEIDGLLDNYFDISQDSLDMQYDPITGNSIEQRGSTPSSEDGSRRGRPLYSDLSIARTNIMRIPSQPAASGQLDTGVPYQESPLAHRSPPHSRPTLVLAGDHSIEEGMSAMSVAGSAAQPLPPPQEPAGIGEQSRSRSRGASTTGAQSTYSDPFDLYLSESGFEQPLGQEYFDNIDRMVQSGQATRAGVLANEGGLTGRDVGADAEAYVPSSPRPSPFRLMSTLTSRIFKQICIPYRARHDYHEHSRPLRLQECARRAG
ncbi:hypothetical protein EJ03DRAFT_207682 [Teratosphaeria nubilosa]|uniref:Uncharacterized protein n=1 Tax=Teratosphaeria nubilosa TaxID=161662 RepID=A0A6G1KZP8_9PEZI|nr:hypothetical protein EJ03DRAFT_207682 [Teratosphaeria nubilosa]